MFSAVILSAALVVLLVFPGAGLAKATRVPTSVAFAIGPAVTLGVVGFSTVLLGFTPIRWDIGTAAAVFLILLGLGALWGRAHQRAEHGSEPALGVSRNSALIVAGGVVIGAGVFAGTCMRWLQQRDYRGYDNISQVWDALWHANLIRFIAETGVASPLRTGELINSDTHAAHFYPNAWHALVALAEPLCSWLGAPAGYPRLYNIASVITPAIAVPISVAALAWRLLRERVQERWAACGAAAAAVVSSLLPSLYEEEAFGSVPSAVAVGLAPVVVVFAMSCLRDRSRLPVAMLAFAGTIATHPSAAFVVAFALVLWWLTQLLWRPARSRQGDFATLAAVPFGAGVLLSPMVLGLAEASDEVGKFPFYWYDLSLTHTQAALRAAGLLTRTMDESVPFERRAHMLAPLLVVAAVGLVVTLLLRQWWALLTWALFAVLAANDWKPFGPAVCDPGPVCHPATAPILSPNTPMPNYEWPTWSFPWFLDKVSDNFYHDPHRLAEVLALFTAGFFGVAVGGALALLARSRLRVLPYLALLPVVAALLVYADRVHTTHGALANVTRHDVLVGPEDVAAYHWLAGQPIAMSTVVLNNLDQGTGWMYAEAGLKPMFTHYRSPHWSADQNCVFWFGASAGRDWRVAAALRRLNVRYIFESPPSYWPDPDPAHDPFHWLIGAPGIDPVYHDGPVTIYVVTAPAQRHDQEDPVVSKDRFHFCRG